MVRLLTALLLLGLGCEGGQPPGFDFGISDADGGGDDVSGADTGDAGPEEDGDADGGTTGLYGGTCLEPVIACFDFALPCTQEPLPGSPGFTAVFDNGASLTIDFGAGTQVATGSDGAECWSSTTDPATNDYIYTTSSGTYRERVSATGREISCPDGSLDEAPAGEAPWVEAVNQCSVPE